MFHIKKYFAAASGSVMDATRLGQQMIDAKYRPEDME